MLKFEEWDINKLIPYARNPRKNDEQVDRMCSAIREFGFRIPIVAKSDGTVVDGHLRLKAAKKLKLETVPVVLADDLTDTQIKAFRLLANQSANWAEWDVDLLSLELEELKELDFDVSLIGFEDFSPAEEVDFDSFLKEIEDKDSIKKSEEQEEPADVYKCPHCGKEFKLDELIK